MHLLTPGPRLGGAGSSERRALQANPAALPLDEVPIGDAIDGRVLDASSDELVTGSFGYLSSLYKVVDSTDGVSYALRRVERVRTNNDMVVAPWKSCHVRCRCATAGASWCTRASSPSATAS